MLDHGRISFIGSGNMAEAMINGLLEAKLVTADQIIATGPRPERGTELSQRYVGITTAIDNCLALEADIIVLAVKPQKLAHVMGQLGGQIKATQLIVSIAAGVTLATLVQGLNQSSVVRCMPNTPGRIGQGITVWTCTSEVTKLQKQQVGNLLRSLGEEVFVDEEEHLDRATAISGTGPAFVLYFMEALTDAAVRIGLPRYLAEHLTVQTVKGTALYAEAFKIHFAQLRNDVTSPGGTSAEALHKLEQASVRAAMATAVKAAYRKSLDLGRTLAAKLSRD